MQQRYLGSEDVRITFVGHATTLVEMGGMTIMTDPLFRSEFRGLRRNEAVPNVDLKSVDLVVLSHMHFDHMDYPSLRMIPDDVPIIAPAGASRYLRRHIDHDIAEMQVGESMQIGSVEIHATPARHDSGFYWPMWLPKTVLSYMFVGHQTVHFVGDTALFTGMKRLGQEFDIDVALLPVWGFGPYLRGDHMTPAQAATAVSMLNPRVAVPIHWGTLRPMGPWWRKASFLKQPPQVFAEETLRKAPDTGVRVLRPGTDTVVEFAQKPIEVVSAIPAGEPALNPTS